MVPFDGDDARTAPSTRVAHVVRGTLGDREVRLSEYDARAVGAFRHCRDGITRSTWDAARKVWSVPASRWLCVSRLLTAEGFRISERDPTPSPGMRRFAAARQRVQHARDDARWIAGIESLAEPES